MRITHETGGDDDYVENEYANGAKVCIVECVFCVVCAVCRVPVRSCIGVCGNVKTRQELSSISNFGLRPHSYGYQLELGYLASSGAAAAFRDDFATEPQTEQGNRENLLQPK